MDTTTILLLSPIIAIQLTLAIICLVNISKKPKTKYLNKIIWVPLILFVGYIGSIAYLILESSQGEEDDSN